MSHRVICAGHVNWDVTLRVDALPRPDGEATITEHHQSGGGSASNVASALATLDVDAALLGSVGSDEHGHLVRRELTEAGVGCSSLVTADGETAVKYLVVDADGEVMVLGNEGANEAFEADDLSEESLATADHLHLTSQQPDTAATLASRAHDASVPTSFDPGRRIEHRDYGPVFDLADVVFLNEREATTAIDHYFGDVNDVGGVVVIKHGSGGAEVITPHGSYTSHDGFDVEATDTTGAGDAFAAGFIAATVGESRPDYEAALAVANACGALAATETGARADLSWDAIDDLTAG